MGPVGVGGAGTTKGGHSQYLEEVWKTTLCRTYVGGFLPSRPTQDCSSSGSPSMRGSRGQCEFRVRLGTDKVYRQTT